MAQTNLFDELISKGTGLVGLLGIALGAFLKYKDKDVAEEQAAVDAGNGTNVSSVSGTDTSYKGDNLPSKVDVQEATQYTSGLSDAGVQAGTDTRYTGGARTSSSTVVTK